MSSSSPFPLDIQIGISIYAIILILLSLVGNSLVIYIVCTRTHMRNSTNILIANMAIGDLLLTIDIPYVLKWFYVSESWFGDGFVPDFLCRFFHSAQMGSITCSVLTLVVISLDRCFAITYPLRRVFEGKVLKGSILSIWLLALGFSTPMIIVTQARISHASHPVCNEFWVDYPLMNEKVFIVVFSICTYFVPLVLIAVVYLITAIRLLKRKLPGNQNLLAQEKVHATSKKATIMLITVVLVFAFCWLPLQVRELLQFYKKTVQVPLKVDIVLPWIGFTNIAINPILYIIFSENYRREFLRILCCHETHKMDILHGFNTIADSRRATPMTTPIAPRRQSEHHPHRLNTDVNRHLLSPSNESIELLNLHSGTAK